jgi:lambda family phage portal protein
MNVLDRCIGWAVPQWGVRRARARIALGMVRSYEAAKVARDSNRLPAPATGANAETRFALPKLRNLSREAYRNSPIVRKAVRTLAGKIVHTGIEPRPNTGNAKLDDEIRSAFDAWFPDCCFERGRDFFNTQWTAVHEMLEAGEVLTERAILKNRGATVPLKFRPMEADHLDHTRNERRLDGSIVVQGVEKDADGAETNYWLFPRHPGEDWIDGGRSFVSDPHRAADIVHMFDRTRFGAVRGVPWCHAILDELRDLGDYRAAERMRKKLEACQVGVLIDTSSSDGLKHGATGLTDQQGNPVDSFEPGSLLVSNGATDIKFNNPTVNPDHAGYVYQGLQFAAAGTLMTYELLSGDLSKVNYSSIRAGLTSLNEVVEQIQWLVVIPMDCRPKWRWFIDAAYLAGRISRRHYGVEWATPKVASADPLKDFLADLGEMRAGLLPPQRASARRGYDWRSNIKDYAAFNAAVDKAGLVFTCDPRKVTETGAASGVDPTDGASDPAARALSVARTAITILRAENDPEAGALEEAIFGN